MTDALITSRDGIVGSYQHPATPPDHLAVEDEDNVERWAPEVRASVIDFELHSRLGFGDAGRADGKTLSHLKITSGANAGDPPVVGYEPLVTLIRPSEDTFLKQLKFVASLADLRTDRNAETLVQLTGPLAFISSVAFVHPDSKRWTLELIQTALRLAIFAEMRFKHALACRRPMEYSPQIQPMILTPAHGTLPSGHATESFISALVLWELLRAAGTKPYRKALWGEQFMRTAARIAINRHVAGVHFPVDSAAGAVLGLTLGHYFVQRCTHGTRYDAYTFDGSKPEADEDFAWYRFYAAGEDERTDDGGTTIPAVDPGQLDSSPYVTKHADNVLGDQGQSALLNWLWEKAKGEWT